jgi:hypothetical protein
MTEQAKELRRSPSRSRDDRGANHIGLAKVFNRGLIQGFIAVVEAPALGLRRLRQLDGAIRSDHARV